MLLIIIPKLPMKNKSLTRDFYINKLGFKDIGIHEFDHYLIVQKDQLEIHFFEFKNLNPLENYGQIYIRINGIDEFYKSLLLNKVEIHPNGLLANKPWQQREFSILDPDHNLITFGQALN